MAQPTAKSTIQDITSDIKFTKWLGSSRTADAPGVMFLYRGQKSDPKRQTADPDLVWIAADCAGRISPIEFVMIDTRKVADVFTRLEIQGGTPKLAFVRNRGGAGGSSQRLEVVGITFMNPDRDNFQKWIQDRLTQP